MVKCVQGPRMMATLLGILLGLRNSTKRKKGSQTQNLQICKGNSIDLSFSLFLCGSSHLCHVLFVPSAFLHAGWTHCLMQCHVRLAKWWFNNRMPNWVWNAYWGCSRVPPTPDICTIDTKLLCHEKLNESTWWMYWIHLLCWVLCVQLSSGVSWQVQFDWSYSYDWFGANCLNSIDMIRLLTRPESLLGQSVMLTHQLKVACPFKFNFNSIH